MDYRELRASEPQSRWVTWMRVVLRIGRFLAVCLIMLVIYSLCDNSMDQQLSMRAKLETLKTERTALRTERDKLKRRMEWIRSDNAYLETVARDRLHLQKEGEYVLRFE